MVRKTRGKRGHPAVTGFLEISYPGTESCPTSPPPAVLLTEVNNVKNQRYGFPRSDNGAL